MTAPEDRPYPDFGRQLRARAHFFAAYADARPGGVWFDGDLDPDQPIGEEPLPPDYDIEAVERMDAQAAESYRQAAVTILPVDLDQGREYLREAARRFRALGEPYGLFVDVIADPGTDAIDEAYDRLGSVVDRDPSEVAVPDLFVLLAATPDPRTWYRFPGLETAAHGQAWHVAGPAGLPLADWWRFGEAIGHPDRFRDVADHLRRLGRIHGAVLKAMYADEYHWRTAHFRADLVDLAIVGAAYLARRRHEMTEIPGLSDSFDRVSLDVGLRLAGPDAHGPVESAAALFRPDQRPM